MIDRYPRELNEEQVAALRLLSHQVMTQLELRRSVKSLEHALEEEKKKTKKRSGV